MFDGLSYELLNKINISVLTGAHVFLDEKWYSEMFSSPYSRLYFVNEGHGFLETEHGRVTLSKGNAYLIPADCTFSYSCSYLEKIYFHITVDTTEKYDLLSKIGCICSLPFSKEQYTSCLELMTSKSYEELLQLKSLLTEVVARFVANFSTEKNYVKEYGKLVKSAIEYIHQNTKVSLSVREIANALFVSESTLRNAFLKEMEMPIGKYIDDMVFRKAKQLLAHEELPIAQISSMLGFCDQFYFSRRFKEKIGEPPSAFRKKSVLLSFPKSL